MNNPMSRIFAGIAIFMLVVSMACTLSSGTPTSLPQPTSATAVRPSTPEASTTDTPQAAPTTKAGNPVPTAPASASGSGGCANAYYPVTSGDSWSYASNSTTSDGTSVFSYTYTSTITAVSDKGFTTGIQASSGVNSIVNWNCQRGNLAVLDTGGATTTTSKVKLNYNSVSADGYNIPATFDAGKTWTETITATATVAVSPTRTVNSQIVSQLNCNAAGADTIALPVGNFDTVKATCSKTVVVSAIVQGKITPGGTVQESITYWYAKKVGLVKSIAIINGAGNNSGTTPAAIQTVVLTQYRVQ
jgi:hypothetical protein